jgi:hypothetical protein
MVAMILLALPFFTVNYELNKIKPYFCQKHLN